MDVVVCANARSGLKNLGQALRRARQRRLLVANACAWNQIASIHFLSMILLILFVLILFDRPFQKLKDIDIDVRC